MKKALFVLSALFLGLVTSRSHAQSFFGFEGVPYATQTSFNETDAKTHVTASFSSFDITTDAFQVLDNTYTPTVPFYSFNMSNHVLIENSVGEHALVVRFSAMQKALTLSFGLPNASARLIVEVPQLELTQVYAGANKKPAVGRDLPYEGKVTINAKGSFFEAIKIYTTSATDGAFGVDNLKGTTWKSGIHAGSFSGGPGASAVPEGSSLLMLGLGGIPVLALLARRRRAS